MGKIKRYITEKGAGFYVAGISFWLSLGGMIFYCMDSTTNNDFDARIVLPVGFAVLLGIVNFALSLARKDIDPLELVPIVSGVLMAMGFGIYLKDRVDVLGYILTGHYSFEKDYPYLLGALLFMVAAFVSAIVAGFLKQKKDL